ncbi:MAG: response regulator transcription factor [Burkholderiaceae bacterium]
MISASSQPDPSKFHASDLSLGKYQAFNGRYKLLIVDDHPLFRDGFVSLMKMFVRDANCVTAESVAGMRASVHQHGKGFDCVFLDLELPDASGIESLRAALNLLPRVPIIVVSGYTSESAKRQCLSLGARDILDKSLSPTDLIQTAAGILSELEPRNLEHPTAPHVPDENDDPIRILSPRQMDVLKLMLGGLGNRAIARQLDIAEGTVKVHVSRILKTLRASSRAEAIARFRGKPLG